MSSTVCYITSENMGRNVNWGRDVDCVRVCIKLMVLCKHFS